jgi:hypothetical protein
MHEHFLPHALACHGHCPITQGTIEHRSMPHLSHTVLHRQLHRHTQPLPLLGSLLGDVLTCGQRQHESQVPSLQCQVHANGGAARTQVPLLSGAEKSSVSLNQVCHEAAGRRPPNTFAQIWGSELPPTHCAQCCCCSPIFLGDRPRGPIFGASDDAAPTSPPVARTYTSTTALGSNLGACMQTTIHSSTCHLGLPDAAGRSVERLSRPDDARYAADMPHVLRLGRNINTSKLAACALRQHTGPLSSFARYAPSRRTAAAPAGGPATALLTREEQARHAGSKQAGRYHVGVIS